MRDSDSNRSLHTYKEENGEEKTDRKLTQIEILKKNAVCENSFGWSTSKETLAHI